MVRKSVRDALERWHPSLDAGGADVIAGVRIKMVTAGTMFAIGGLLVIATSSTMDARASIWVPIAIGVLTMVVGAALLLLRHEGATWMLHAALVFGTAVIVAATALSDDLASLITASSFMVWLAVYAACFFVPRQAVAHVAFAYAALTVAVVAVAPDRAVLVVGSSLVNSLVIGCCVGWLATRLRGAALVDPLTGVANSRALRSVVRFEFDRADRAGQPVSVAGDDAIAAVARTLTEGVRSVDFVARVGGDEFIVVLPDATEATASAALARVREESPVPFSVGVTERRPGETPEQVMERADRAMYAMKHGERRHGQVSSGRVRRDRRGSGRSPRSSERR
jgi:GGDEF domain-containing protein